MLYYIKKYIDFGGQNMTIRRSKLRRIYEIIMAGLLVLTGLCLMVQCYAIYASAEGVFSREIVAQYFSPIAVPTCLCLAMVILGFFLPADTKKLPPEKNYELILEKLHAKTDLDACPEELRAAVTREQNRRKHLKYTTFFLFCTGIVEFFGYALKADAFHQHEINASMIQAMACLVPCLVIPFGCGVYSAYQSKASILREIELLKTADAPRVTVPEAPRNPSKIPSILRWAVMAVAVGILIYGYATGGTADVLTKAINICTECVGLG